MNAKRLLFLTIMALCATSAWAYDFSAVAPSGQTLYYNIVAGNAQVTYQSTTSPRYSNLSGNLVIPASVTYGGNTYAVTSIGEYAFEGCSGLTSVTIPDAVTSIGEYAFCDCSGLTSLTIPNSVTSIGKRAFYYCTGLTSVIINADSCTRAGELSYYNNNNSAFAGCTNITNFTFGDSVKVIPSYLCYDMAGLTSVTIPNSVTSIGEWAFSNCSGLTSVTIPNSVTSIGQYAFSDCSGLTSVTIPNSVTSIGDWAFGRCSGLTSVTIPNSVTSIGIYAFAGCGGLTSISIPNSVTSIGEYAFCDCSGLTSLTIPNSVTSIGDGAFYGCSGLTSLTIPNSVTSIGEWAFRDCSGLTSVAIPNSVTSTGYGAFYGCSGLTSLTIPNSVTSIGEYAFSRCSGLTSVTIGNSVTSIGDYAFEGCSGLTSVTIPDSVTSIGYHAFYGCSGLAEVTMLDETAPTLRGNAFAGNAENRVFNIPCGSYDSYFNGSGWDSYQTALHELVVELNIGANDSIKGIASIIQQNERDVTCDSSAIIIATASYGYHFDHWSNGNTANPDTLHLVGDSTVTAIFAVNQYELAVQSADESLGSADGSGTYNYLDTVTISAQAVEHYHFIHWNDGNRENPRQVVVTGDLSFTAFFAIDTHTVHVTTNDIARGMVEATGTEFVYGTPCTVTATAYTGYTFAGWSNGVNANPYTFAVLSDVELTALFVAEGEQTYTVTVVSDDPTMGTVSGGGQALDGGTVTIRAVGNPGYHFLRWNDNNTDSVRTVEVHGNVTYTAYFASNSTEAIDDVNGSNIKVYAINGRIVVEGRENRPVWVFDMYGRVVDNGRLPSGVYLVKVGNLPARKVVVIR